PPVRRGTPPCPTTLDCRTVDVVGRAARLDLTFEYRRGRTILSRAYAEPPFRIGRSFEAAGGAYAIVVCAAPGVLAGDQLQQCVHVGRGAHVRLPSQPALRAH